MERLTWEQITRKYPSHLVGLNNVIKDDKGNVVSAELVYGVRWGEDPPEDSEVDLVIFTDPCPFGALNFGWDIDVIIRATTESEAED